MSSFLPPGKISRVKERALLELRVAHGPNDPFWASRTCFVPPDASPREVTYSLSQAAEALLSGDRTLAIEQTRTAERADVLAWGMPIMSFVQPKIARWRPIDKTNLPLIGRVDTGSFTRPLLARMYRRDGWRCRWCGTRVVTPEVCKRFRALLPGVIRFENAHGDHAGFHIVKGVADHIQPHSRGGPTTLDNLVTCCQPCNYGRGEAFLEELGLIDPRTRDPYPAEDWDGLERLLALSVPRQEPHAQQPEVNWAVWAEFSHLVAAKYTN